VSFGQQTSPKNGDTDGQWAVPFCIETWGDTDGGGHA